MSLAPAVVIQHPKVALRLRIAALRRSRKLFELRLRRPPPLLARTPRVLPIRRLPIRRLFERNHRRRRAPIIRPCRSTSRRRKQHNEQGAKRPTTQHQLRINQCAHLIGADHTYPRCEQFYPRFDTRPTPCAFLGSRFGTGLLSQYTLDKTLILW